ncbi:hypothetical protein A3H80_04700 [Candidatus Roizmanbacteria bacterium RIFCSPLOWO2_02_FULL_37_19]|uniref:General secretion pathway GspH domain-containing protein n=1 Tax=Candidatus Roizmanbacteria bacterium RIFCSPHIGHO2_02_FULL_37_24 TaxID=1802037 RepID=A0A1F7GYI8_9BACT|nr:MAG: hypothetical protein A2862_00140 [Candidatus Roizmanbacteria bacterium RIFCSPHIGHO2_01_FULL_38_41]OGK24001.1 MAG: hypothetical protein A3C24_02835 [Candidatus Roizmanbacteria bacterium RIFCSPHIGHO2_02_FULL_37_24]OGK32385.1 MAG: hypothetical protein A3E10_04355 [Candidatus Roizmanbacteria bacterium RIFCSPHIGHO2_12_FULL_37_23]OGK44255.1 MAG: hypothetical protein A2956_00200 [Candidatus Roizmanbacteria bacterium RIFCSPLOWO2_01_FULL_37_57]OGK54158.1 MAG: hypothetical protein A3H80_04700 [Ca
MSKGFSLIELVVATSIIATLSLISVLSIVRFQKTTILDNTTAELDSTIHLAQSKSVSGELLEEEEPDDFEENGLPQYGVQVSSDEYTMFRDIQRVGESSTRETLESYSINDFVTISPTAEVVFSRIQGATSATTFTIQGANSESRQVIISADGQITIQRL